MNFCNLKVLNGRRGSLILECCSPTIHETGLSRDITAHPPWEGGMGFWFLLVPELCAATSTGRQGFGRCDHRPTEKKVLWDMMPSKSKGEKGSLGSVAF